MTYRIKTKRLQTYKQLKNTTAGDKIFHGGDNFFTVGTSCFKAGTSFLRQGPLFYGGGQIFYGGDKIFYGGDKFLTAGNVLSEPPYYNVPPYQYKDSKMFDDGDRARTDRSR